MIISGYGIKLIRLTKDDIELVRNHRNSETIKQFMEFRDNISSAQQLIWFESINNLNNNYFIINYNNKKVGLIYGADIDWVKEETGNGGIFIWELSCWNTFVPIASSFLLTDISVLLGLKKTYIKVLKENKSAIAFNKSLGYKILPNQSENINQKYVLETPDYISCRDNLREKIFKKSDYENIEFELNKDNEIDKFYIEKINTLPDKNKRNFDFKF